MFLLFLQIYNMFCILANVIFIHVMFKPFQFLSFQSVSYKNTYAPPSSVATFYVFTNFAMLWTGFGFLIVLYFA